MRALRVLLAVALWSTSLAPLPMLGAGSAFAAVPWMINYQGRLTDTGSVAVTGTYTMTFRLYDAATSGTKLWQEQQTVTLAESDSGIFSVVLGAVDALSSVDFNNPVWLSVQVADDSEMTPRQRLTAVGYAMNADLLDGLSSTAFLRTDVDTSSSGKLTLTKSGTALLVKPSTDPAANTALLDLQNAAGTSKFKVDLEGDTTVAGNLAVSGTISGTTAISGTTNTTWTVDSDATGTEPASGAGLVIEGGSGDASIVWDATNDELDISHAVNVATNATLSAQGDVRFADADSSAYLALQAPATVASNITWTLPSADATVSGQALTSNAAGALSWTTVDTSTADDAPTSASYLTLGVDATLSAERVLTEGNYLDLTDAGANSTLTIAMDPTEVGSVTWGTTNATWTFDTSGTDPTIGWSSAAFDIDATVTVDDLVCETAGCLGAAELGSSGVTAASYGTSSAVPTIAVDEDGRITSASNTTIVVTDAGSATTSTTFTIDSDNTSGSEPASGAGLVIEGGSGDASILWDATNDELDVNKDLALTGDMLIDTTGSADLAASGGSPSLDNRTATESLAIATSHSATDSDGVIKLGRDASDYEYIWYDNSARSGAGEFVFSASTRVESSSPAYLMFSPPTLSGGTPQPRYGLKFNPDGNVNTLTFLKMSSPFTTSDETPLFEFAPDGSYSVYDSSGNKSTVISAGRQWQQEFENVIFNGSFEAFSGGTSETGSASGTNFLNSIMDGWSNLGGATMSRVYAPSFAGTSTGDVKFGYAAVKVEDSGATNAQGIQQEIQPFDLRELRGKSVTLAVFAKKGGAGSLTTPTLVGYEAWGSDGTSVGSGTKQATVNIDNSGFKLIDYTFTVPATTYRLFVRLYGADAAAGSNTCTGACGGIIYDGVTLVAGSMVAPFRPSPIKDTGFQTLYGDLEVAKSGVMADQNAYGVSAGGNLGVQGKLNVGGGAEIMGGSLTLGQSGAQGGIWAYPMGAHATTAYKYVVTSLDGSNIESLAREVFVPDGPNTLSATDKIRIDWSPVPSSTYVLYGRTPNGFGCLRGGATPCADTTALTATSFEDTGTGSPSTLHQPPAFSGGAFTPPGSITMQGGLRVGTGGTPNVQVGSSAVNPGNTYIEGNLQVGGTIYGTVSGGTNGTVTSVGLSAPPEFTVSNSPVTGAGTLTLTKVNQNPNLVYAGPASGGAAAPTFRALVDADVPDTITASNYLQLQGSTPGTQQTGHLNISGVGLFNQVKPTIADNDAVVALSGNAGNWVAMSIGRTAAESKWGVAQGAGAFASDAQAGDIILRTENTANKLRLLSGTGTSALTIASASPHVAVGGDLDVTGTVQVGANNQTLDSPAAGVLSTSGDLRVMDNDIQDSSGESRINFVAGAYSNIFENAVIGSWNTSFSLGDVSWMSLGDGRLVASALRIGPNDAVLDSGPTAPINELRTSGNLQVRGNVDTPFGGIGRFQNVLLRSEEFNDAAWVKSASTTSTTDTIAAPDGTTTAEAVTFGTAGLDSLKQISTTAAGSTQFTGSVWLKAASGTPTVRLGLLDEAGTPASTYANAVLSTTWQRFQVTKTFAGATGNAVLMLEDNTDASGTLVVHAWGAQLESTVGTAGVYAKTTTTAVTASRGLVSNTDLSTFGTLTSGTLRLPNSATLPGTCAVGDTYMDTDATSGQRFYLCQSANVWALQGDGGAGGAYSTVQDETNALTQRATVNFTGSGVTCVDNAGSTRTDCTIAAGGDVSTTGQNILTSPTASPVLLRPSSAPAGNTKLFDVQTTGTTTSVASVDAEGDTILNSLTLTTDLAIADGGTGASDAATARTNLGLAAGGAGDIWVEKAGDTLTGGLTFSNVATEVTTAGNEDLTLNAAGTGKTIIADTLQVNSNAIADSGGTTRLTLATASPHVTLTGNLDIGGSILQQPTVAPTIKGSVTDATRLNLAIGVAVQGDYAYVIYDGTGVGGITVVDVSNPASPVMVGGSSFSHANLDAPTSIQVVGRYAYVTSSTNRLNIVDISNPTTLSLTGSVLDATYLSNATDVYVAGPYAYVAAYGSDYLTVVDVSNPVVPAVKGFLQFSAFTNNVYSVWVQGKYAYLVTGGTGISANDEGLYVVDVSNPAAPSLTGSVGQAGLEMHGVRDVIVSGRYAYMANNGDTSITIVDVKDPATPAITSSSSSGFEALTVSGKYAYAPYGAGAGTIFRVYDVSNPSSLVLKALLSDASFADPYRIVVAGKYAYVVSSPNDKLIIVDLNGADLPAIAAGSVSAGTMDVQDNLQVGNSVSVGHGMQVGVGGLLSQGNVTVSGNLGVTGTLTFSGVATDITTGANEHLALMPNGTGSVGIGTTTPGASTKLNVAGMGLFTGGAVNPGDGTAAGVSVGYNTASDYGFIQAVHTAVAWKNLILQPSANNVGIGTTTPVTKLDVNGALTINTAGLKTLDGANPTPVAIGTTMPDSTYAVLLTITQDANPQGNVNNLDVCKVYNKSTTAFDIYCYYENGSTGKIEASTSTTATVNWLVIDY